MSYTAMPATSRSPSNALLEGLLLVAGRTMRVSGGRLDIRHACVERRISHLNLYPAKKRGPRVDNVRLDRGQAITAPGCAHIFPYRRHRRLQEGTSSFPCPLD